MFIARVTVPENDFPYGVLQLATSPPIVGIPFTPQATSAPVFDVMESDGTITIYIVRAQGLIGTVRTELITEDGSAIGGMDYLSTAAELVFAEGERFKTMQLQILDDSLPELGKHFSVNLTNPTGSKIQHVYLNQKLINFVLHRSPASSIAYCKHYGHQYSTQ